MVIIGENDIKEVETTTATNSDEVITVNFELHEYLSPNKNKRTYSTEALAEVNGIKPGVETVETDVVYMEPLPKKHNFVKAMIRGAITNERNEKYPQFSNRRIRFKQLMKAGRLYFKQK